jgi:CHAT domain-containing protein
LLLAAEPPASSPLEVSVRKKIVQGWALCGLNKNGDAQVLLSEAEHMIPGAERNLAAELAFARAMCALAADRALAQQYYAQAAELAHGRDQFIEANSLLGVGYVFLQDHLYDEAIARFDKALRLTDSRLVKERALGNLAECYAALGDWLQSISLADQAEKLAEQIQDTPSQKTWLIDLGKAHFAQWEFPAAERNYLKALSMAQQLHDQNSIALCFYNLSLLALRQRDVDKADQYRRQGEALKVDSERLHLALDAAEIAAARKQWPEAERLFQELLSQTATDAILLSMVQRELGKVYKNEKKIAQADQMFRAGINTAEQAVAKLKRPEYRMSFMDQDPFYDSYIQFLVEQNKPEDALRIAERSRAQVLAAALENGKAREPSLSVAALKALAKRRGQIILAYSMTDEESFLWVIASSEFKLLRHLPGHRELFTQIDAFNHEIQNRRLIEVSPAGQKLYQTLIQPVAKEILIPTGSSVTIVPSKFLSLVNFEALIVPGPEPHYWIDDVDVQVTGSLALFAAAKPAAQEHRPSRKELLAFGAPIQADRDFPTLKHAAEEMRRVQSHFLSDQVTTISGQEATPEAYRASNPGQYRFLHFDTHGVASDLNPLDSAVILSRGRDTYRLLAGDIKDIPLHADLVTISACYGAGTRWYQGEGLVGLTWAFLHAGAHQVVGALWEVDESSSPQLMDDFYGELAKGKSVAEALREAKRKMRQPGSSYSSPYYWASLQVYTGA